MLVIVVTKKQKAAFNQLLWMPIDTTRHRPSDIGRMVLHRIHEISLSSADDGAGSSGANSLVSNVGKGPRMRKTHLYCHLLMVLVTAIVAELTIRTESG